LLLIFLPCLLENQVRFPEHPAKRHTFTGIRLDIFARPARDRVSAGMGEASLPAMEKPNPFHYRPISQTPKLPSANYPTPKLPAPARPGSGIFYLSAGYQSLTDAFLLVFFAEEEVWNDQLQKTGGKTGYGIPGHTFLLFFLIFGQHTTISREGPKGHKKYKKMEIPMGQIRTDSTKRYQCAHLIC